MFSLGQFFAMVSFMQNSPIDSTTSLSVSQLNAKMKRLIEGQQQVLKVFGEISNLSKPRSGHLYFTLKDQDAEIPCVMFRMHAQSCQAHDVLFHGAAVQLEGQVTLYAPRGQYQFMAQRAYLYGEGMLRQQYLALEKQLSAEGLFNQAVKKPLPPFPKTVAVISSPQAAGLQDFLKVMRQRYPICAIRLYPALVQGKQAAVSLCQALQRASCDPGLDAIILCRGGGSMEDLWCFNDPALIRAVYACHIPVVSAIGHEIDHTLCDKVADVRAATPTQGAMLLTPDTQDLQRKLAQLGALVASSMRQVLARRAWQLEHIRSRLTHPREKIAAQRDLLARHQHSLMLQISNMVIYLQQRLTHASSGLQAQRFKQQLAGKKAIVYQNEQRLRHFAHQWLQQQSSLLGLYREKLTALNPKNILQRGYAIAEKNGRVVSSTQDIQPGDTVCLQLVDGKKQLTVDPS